MDKPSQCEGFSSIKEMGEIMANIRQQLKRIEKRIPGEDDRIFIVIHSVDREPDYRKKLEGESYEEYRDYVESLGFLTVLV